MVGTIERKTNRWKAEVNVSSDILLWERRGGKALVTRVFHAGSAFCDPFARAYTLRPFTTINHRANRSELRTTVIQPFNRFSLGWISLWASRAIRCFLTFTEKGEPKISEAIYPRNSILFVAVKGGAIIMFIGLKNIDRIAEGMFFIFIFFFLSCEYYRFPSTRGIENKIFWNIEIRESFKDWRSIEQKLGEEIMQLLRMKI